MSRFVIPLVVGSRRGVGIALGTLATLAAAAGCSPGGSRGGERAPDDSARIVTKDVKPDAPQARELRAGIEAHLTDDLTPSFVDAWAQARGRSDAQAARLGKATAYAVSMRIGAKARGEAPTSCRFELFDLTTWSKCVLREVLAENLDDAAGLRALLAGVVAPGNEQILGNVATLRADLEAQGADVLGKVGKVISSLENVERLLSRIVRAVDGVKDSLSVIARGAVVAEAPYVSERFFAGRSFVLTTSFAQGSVGSQRMYNLASHIVSLRVDSGRLVVLRDGSDLYDSENVVDVIVGAYPILRSVKVGEETFHQIDFSQPYNKQFLVQHLVGGDAQMSLSADIVVPRVAHAGKKVVPALGSGLRFGSEDSSLVVDSLVLVNGTEPAVPPGAETNPLALDKDVVRPTVHVVQGLFALDARSDAFAKEQAQDVSWVQRALAAAGVEDRSQTGNAEQDRGNVPYFTGGVTLADERGRPREWREPVRKFDSSRPIVWVVGASTPKAAIPVVKSAVLSFERLFADLAPEGKPAPKVEVYTQAEFEEANRSSGLALGGGPLHAADPRVNMIYWDESQLLGSAWATAAANPRTGEVLSADVMLSGHMWAKQGCLAFFQKTWTFAQSKPGPGSKRKGGPVPNAAHRFAWDMRCEAEMLKLGFYESFGEGETFPMPVGDDDAIVRATRAGDDEALARIAETLATHFGSSVSSGALGSPSGSDVGSARAVQILSDAIGGRGLGFSHGDAATPVGNGDSPDVSSVKDVVARARQLARAYRSEERGEGNANPSSLNGRGSFVRLTSGKNLLAMPLDCRKLVSSAALELADIGSPANPSELVASPSAGAFALLRATLLHELGHAFGLRHNFAGSLNAAKLADGAVPATPVQSATDSIMDYNDYGIDFAFGGMSDYASERGGWDTPSFGAYDVVALGAAYGLDLASLPMSGKTVFCTDGNVVPLGTCQRYDFGADDMEFNLHDLNINLSRLANVQAVDLLLVGVDELILPRLSRVLDGVRKIALAWGVAQHTANATTGLEERTALLAKAELSFRGLGAKQDFVKGFPERMGRPLLGLWDVIDLPPSFFDEPAFADIFNDLIRAEAAMSILAVNDVLRGRDADDNADDAFFTAIHDVKLGGLVFPYRSALMDLAAGRILRPAGSPLPVNYFDGGVRDGSGLTVDGKPLLVTLDVPFFNHRGQLAVLKDVAVDDATVPGGKSPKVLRLNGTEKLTQMVLDATLLASLAPGWSESPSALRISEDRAALRAIIDGSESCTPGTPTCYAISQTALRAAGFTLDLYGEALTLASRSQPPVE